MEYIYDIESLEMQVQSAAEKFHLKESLHALQYAKEKHKGQLRSEGIPYFVHPLMMACHALALGIREDNFIALLLLHDVCEDCHVLPEELPFNEAIRHGVYCMTHEKEPGENKDISMDRYMQKVSSSRDASLCKLFDRCNNVSTMACAFSDKKLSSYIIETKVHIYPLFEYVKETYPELSHILFVLEYHTKSVINSLENGC